MLEKMEDLTEMWSYLKTFHICWHRLGPMAAFGAICIVKASKILWRTWGKGESKIKKKTQKTLKMTYRRHMTLQILVWRKSRDRIWKKVGKEKYIFFRWKLITSWSRQDCHYVDKEADGNNWTQKRSDAIMNEKKNK